MLQWAPSFGYVFHYVENVFPFWVKKCWTPFTSLTQFSIQSGPISVNFFFFNFFPFIKKLIKANLVKFGIIWQLLVEENPNNKPWFKCILPWAHNKRWYLRKSILGIIRQFHFTYFVHILSFTEARYMPSTLRRSTQQELMQIFFKCFPSGFVKTA